MRFAALIAALTAMLIAFACEVFGSGWLKPSTNAPPVDPIPRPDVTNAPPVTPPTTVREWTYKSIWAKGGNEKVMDVQAVPRGVVISYYDRKTRTDSWIEERGPDGWKRIWSGDEETIGESPTLGSAAHKGGLMYAAERGRTFLRYDYATGKIGRLAKVPDGYKWNVYVSAWSNRNTVAVGADGPDTQAAVFDAYTGKRLFDSKLNGLIAGMAEDAAGVMWLAVSDGQAGVCTSDGRSWRDFKAASIAHPWGYPVAGSMSDGWLWRYRDGKWSKWKDLDASKVNRLAVMVRAGRPLLLVAASKPDTFAVIHEDGTTERINRFTDEKKESSGEQFDACIAPESETTVLFGRAKAKGCEAYRGTVK